ncbi:MAG: Hsp20/alpha crystallin family protein [Gammaproteobacteria bacterium]|jgi:HSP20 family protein|nr:Hsp20/alpha crystallin family protein [Gammaproteobacteria bacterium]MDF1688898.1 Hsp20/alpha crystallin family protein [Cycloclasticus sp.]
MALVKYEPWQMLEQFNNIVNHGFLHGDEDSASSIATWIPAVDIKEENDRFLLKADIPGVDPKDIDVSMTDGVLTVRGDRSEEIKEEKDGYKRIERTSGSFYRRFVLPDTTDAEGITANCNKGVLELVIPKKPTSKPKRIEVTGSK